MPRKIGAPMPSPEPALDLERLVTTRQFNATSCVKHTTTTPWPTLSGARR